MAEIWKPWLHPDCHGREDKSLQLSNTQKRLVKRHFQSLGLPTSTNCMMRYEYRLEPHPKKYAGVIEMDYRVTQARRIDDHGDTIDIPIKPRGKLPEIPTPPGMTRQQFKSQLRYNRLREQRGLPPAKPRDTKGAAYLQNARWIQTGNVLRLTRPRLQDGFVTIQSVDGRYVATQGSLTLASGEDLNKVRLEVQRMIRNGIVPKKARRNSPEKVELVEAVIEELQEQSA